MIGKILLLITVCCVFFVAGAFAAVAAAQTPVPPPNMAPQAAQAAPEPQPLSMEDVQSTLKELGDENATMRLRITALTRQVEEWRKRALAAEAKAAPPKHP